MKVFVFLMGLFEGVMIELTNYCNLNCSFCPNQYMKREKVHMNLDLFKKILNEIKEKELSDSITFHLMGEPTLHPEFKEICEVLSKFNFKKTLVTNGCFLDEELSKKIIKARIDQVIISTQSFTDINLENIKSSCKLFKENKVKIGFRFWLWDNIKAEESFIVKEKKESAFILNLIKEIFPLDLQEKILNFKVPGEMKIDDYISFSFNRRFDWNIDFQNEVDCGFCYDPFVFLPILSNGDIVLCCYDYDGKTKMGNVNDSFISDVLRSAKWKKTTKNLINGKLDLGFCKKCRGRISPLERIKIRSKIKSKKVQDLISKHLSYQEL